MSVRESGVGVEGGRWNEHFRGSTP